MLPTVLRHWSLCYSYFVRLLEFYCEIFDVKSYLAPCTLVYLCDPGHEKMCLISYANNKGADQPAHPHCCSLLRYYNNSTLYSRKFKTLASFCGCAGRFLSYLVGNSRRHILSCRSSHVSHISYCLSCMPYFVSVFLFSLVSWVGYDL